MSERRVFGVVGVGWVERRGWVHVREMETAK